MLLLLFFGLTNRTTMLHVDKNLYKLNETSIFNRIYENHVSLKKIKCFILHTDRCPET